MNELLPTIGGSQGAVCAAPEGRPVIRIFPAVEPHHDGEGGCARRGYHRVVRSPVQLRHATPLTSDACLAERAWEKASLARCPRHPAGGCGFARHGTYARKTPTGMRVTRYYCPTAHETFSLLPDCLANRRPSTNVITLGLTLAVPSGCAVARP
jgi:hypothetical protein